MATTNQTLLILKSIGQHLNNKPLSDYNELIKAIAPYTIKTVQNKTLIWVQLPSGKWDWRRFDPNKHNKYLITQTPNPTNTAVPTSDNNAANQPNEDEDDDGFGDYGVDLPDDDEKVEVANQNQTVDPFPVDLSNLNVIQQLGGSTGAYLVEDKTTGNKFVMKKGRDDAHIKEEYITNKLYELLNVRVPQVRFYEEAGQRSTQLSLYLENTEVADINKHLTELQNSFVADCLLANWDAYNNDNLLVDKDTGLLYRIDNGGGLRKRARGSDKGSSFTDNIMDDINSMKSHNPSITQNITNSDIKNQMIDVLAKKQEVLDFLEDFGETELKDKMEARFKSIEDKINAAQIATTKVEDLFKNNESDYRDLTKDEMDAIWDDLLIQPNGIFSRDANSSGWRTLSLIAKHRKFDKRPEVLSEDDFNELLADDDVKLLHRGVPSDTFYNQFINSDNCWYGTVGIYGAGIYSTINTNKQQPPPESAAYTEAKGYGSIVKDMIVTKDFKTITTDEVDKMMNDEFYGPAYQKLKQEITDNITKIQDLEDFIRQKRKMIEQEVRTEMLYDQNILDQMNSPISEADAVDMNKFGSIKDSFKNVVLNLGGEVISDNDNETKLRLPHSSDTFVLSKKLAEVSVKQKSQFTAKYNFHYDKFQKWVKDEHFGKIEVEKQARLAHDKSLKNAWGDIEMYKVLNKKLSKDAQNWSQSSATSSMHPLLVEICKRNSVEARGFYAMLKGYDGLLEGKGNWGNPYMIILNRSKIVVKHKDL